MPPTPNERKFDKNPDHRSRESDTIMSLELKLEDRPCAPIEFNREVFYEVNREGENLALHWRSAMSAD